MKCEIGYEVIVVGAGPAGVQAAVSAATEGLSTVLLAPEGVGGQIGTSPRLENLAGYVYGIPGGQLAAAFENQLHRLGVEVVEGAAQRLVQCHASDGLGVGTEKLTLIGQSVVIATGKRFAEVAVEGTDHECVEYGPQAAMAMGPKVTGKKLVVIGGGNSAGQTIEYLGRRAGEIHVLAGNRGLQTSAYLTEQIEAMPNVEVHRGRLAVIEPSVGAKCSVKYTSPIRPTERLDKVDHVFICAGMVANTEWLDGSGVALLSDGRVAQSSTYGQFATNVRGVFAVGDVRQDGGGRVPIALGEGAAVNRTLWDYLR